MKMKIHARINGYVPGAYWIHIVYGHSRDVFSAAVHQLSLFRQMATLPYLSQHIGLWDRTLKLFNMKSKNVSNCWSFNKAVHPHITCTQNSVSIVIFSKIIAKEVYPTLLDK